MKRKILYLAAVLLLLVTLSSPLGSSASPAGIIQGDAGSNERLEDEIIPAPGGSVTLARPATSPPRSLVCPQPAALTR